MLVRKFYLCTDEVIVQLFKSYVMNLNGGTIWSRLFTEKLRELKVAYNNVLELFYDYEGLEVLLLL